MIIQYVRKTAAICVAELFDINAELVEEIQEKSTSPIFEINSINLSKLLTALNECTEWGHVFIAKLKNGNQDVMYLSRKVLRDVPFLIKLPAMVGQPDLKCAVKPFTPEIAPLFGSH